jgi:hypothetical protein
MPAGMTVFVIVLILLIALGALGAVVKGLLWLTAIAVVLMLVAIWYASRRLKEIGGPSNRS